MPPNETQEEPAWRLIERITALLEQSISSTTNVKHDVRLPVLGSPSGRKRQCDVVITSGEKPRETITIVEVQKRNSKPDITTFHGWVEKMREVGAQHLICVSALGYPRSIIEEANRIGPTVRLLTLKEIEDMRTFCLNMANTVRRTNFKFTIQTVDKIMVKEVSSSETNALTEIKQININIDSNDKIFETHHSHDLISLNDIINKYILEVYPPLIFTSAGDHIINDINIPDMTINKAWLCYNDRKFEIQTMHINIDIEILPSTDIPLKCFSYCQEFFEGELAWVASAKGNVDDKETEFQIVFRQNKEGILEICSAQAKGSTHINLCVFQNEASAKAHAAFARYNTGLALYEQSKYNEAIRAYDEALNLDSKLALAWNSRGVALHSISKNEEAIQSYNEAIKIDQNYCASWYNIGNIRREMENHGAAINAYDNVIKIDPKHIMAWNNKAASLLKLERFDEAIDACKKAVELNPKYLSAWGLMGVALSSSGRQEEAIEAYNEVLKIDPTQAETWYNKGNALLILGNFEDSIKAYDKAIDLKPEYEDAWNNKGNALRGLQRYEEAIIAYGSALKVNSKLTEAWHNMGLTLEDVARKTEAEAAFAKAKELKYEN
jgi:tetratricopeptide (TPR) repeat protein